MRKKTPQKTLPISTTQIEWIDARLVTSSDRFKTEETLQILCSKVAERAGDTLQILCSKSRPVWSWDIMMSEVRMRCVLLNEKRLDRKIRSEARPRAKFSNVRVCCIWWQKAGFETTEEESTFCVPFVRQMISGSGVIGQKREGRYRRNNTQRTRKAAAYRRACLRAYWWRRRRMTLCVLISRSCSCLWQPTFFPSAFWTMWQLLSSTSDVTCLSVWLITRSSEFLSLYFYK